MSNVPEGAELSEDGQWWWDADNQTWQQVEGGGGDSGGGDAGSPGFDFVQGIRIDPVSMGTPSAGEELKAAFQVINTGTAGGQCVVTIYVDGSDSGVKWDSPWLEPGQDAVPDGDGYVAGIPGQSEGEHEFEGFADPPGQYGGRSGANKINVGSAPS
jgi:hypothetical protein